MSKNISHNISAALGLRLGFNAGAGLTYNAADPADKLNQPVKMSANQTVVLCANNDRPIGSIVIVEPSDGSSVKVTVSLGPVVCFNLGTSQTAAGMFGKSVIADGAGGVKPATAGAGLGIVTSVEGSKVYVLTYGGTI
jgi:hypothetical protein